jgi:hypothetical protein
MFGWSIQFVIYGRKYAKNVISVPILDARRPSTVILQITWPGAFIDDNKSSNEETISASRVISWQTSIRLSYHREPVLNVYFGVSWTAQILK